MDEYELEDLARSALEAVTVADNAALHARTAWDGYNPAWARYDRLRHVRDIVCANLINGLRGKEEFAIDRKKYLMVDGIPTLVADLPEKKPSKEEQIAATTARIEHVQREAEADAKTLKGHLEKKRAARRKQPVKQQIPAKQAIKGPVRIAAMTKPNPVPCPFCKPGNSYEIGAETVTLRPSLWQPLWKPIESAPKDGSEIFVCCKAGKPWLAWWCEAAWRWVRVYRESPDAQPTHWLPIPPMEGE